jgi:hypothetical protein
MKTEKRSQYTSVLLFVFLLLSFYVFGQDSITYQGTVVKSGGSAPTNGNYGILKVVVIPEQIVYGRKAISMLMLWQLQVVHFR